jgi:hypothetical protein
MFERGSVDRISLDRKSLFSLDIIFFHFSLDQKILALDRMTKKREKWLKNLT